MNSRLLAQITNPVLPPGLGQGPKEQGATAIGLLISNLIAGMLIFAFVLAFIYLITGAFHWITSGGDKANLENARNKIIHAIIGLIIIAAAWAIIILTGQFLGLDFTKLPIPSFDNSQSLRSRIVGEGDGTRGSRLNAE